MSELVYTILGCGASPGVPRIGNDWGACDPQNPKNRRRRSGFLVERWNGDAVTRVLVDTSPDLREQMLDARVDWIDGVVYTHSHADHLHGIDDLRAFVLNKKQRVRVFMDADTAERVREGFDYCFRTPKSSMYQPILDEHRITAYEPFVVDGAGGDIHIAPFRQIHGGISSLGLRFGDLAYSTDLNDIPDDSLPYLDGLEVWIAAALRRSAHPSHLSVGGVVEWAERFKPKRTILTHMHADLDYQSLVDELPDGIEPGYDGMRIVLPDTNHQN